jgi:ABC-type glycerol-3-phosphate transport system substrate-binding protein
MAARHASAFFLLAAIAAAVLLAACTSVPTNDTAVVGFYGTTLPAASGGGARTLTMKLAADYSVTVTSASSGASRFPMEGKWERSGNRITVNIAGKRPERMVFDYERVRLVAREWERTTWGDEGPGTLARQ